MKKINCGEKKLQEVETKNSQIQNPQPLEFQSKKLTLLCATQKEKENKIIHPKAKQNTKKKALPPPINYPKSNEKQIHTKQKCQIEVNEQEECNCENIQNYSDSSGSSIPKLLPNKINDLYQTKKRRKRQHDRTPFYDQIIYKDPRLRRINFVWSSSGSSDEEYEIVKIKKQVIPEKSSRCTCNCNCKCNQPEQEKKAEIPNPEHILDVKISPLPVKQIPEPLQITKQENRQKAKQPIINKYIQKPPIEEWAKYETPDVQHPQQLKLPQKPPEKKEDGKPIYGKPRERVEFKIPKSDVVQQNFIPKALPPSQIQPGAKKFNNSKSNSMSSNSNSSDFCCCECQCD